ncbi:fumarylacetoacetate hydrolase family protein [Marinibaculum pumilum]|uniref:Fumarylacetoacetate hydrolase family protein n=1 Tax=Marinibaculum pumilum TaxID=1766165 RepID=A0ABV7L855_9PROT
MTNYLYEAMHRPTIAVAGRNDRMHVRRIFCVGRNYAAHTREMGGDPDREAPFFFTKPADAVVDSGATIPYPPETKDLHHEIELVVAIGKEGLHIPKSHALDHVLGYAVGIDLTRRDLQQQAKDKGRPWDWGKAFDHSAPCAPLHLAENIGHPTKGRIWLAVNGETRQDGDIAQLIWNVPEIVAIVSASMRLQAGDLIYTGTPAGVGAIVAGDKITGGIDGLGEIEIEIGQPEAGAGGTGAA